MCDTDKDKRKPRLVDSMEGANYVIHAPKCLFCNQCHDLPDKYWCEQHDCEITDKGICIYYVEGESIKEIIAQVEEPK